MNQAERQAALEKFGNFHEVDPDLITEITIDELPTVVWTLGDLVEVTYYASQFEGRPTLFHHKFRTASRPSLTVTPEERLFIAGGRYRVDERRGIVDRR